jgi:hypothetical protein
MGNMMGALASFGQDSSVLKKRVKSGTAKRTIAFAALYAWLLALFLLVVIASASISIANPLIRVKPSKNAPDPSITRTCGSSVVGEEGVRAHG